MILKNKSKYLIQLLSSYYNEKIISRMYSDIIDSLQFSLYFREGSLRQVTHGRLELPHGKS